MRHTKIQFHQNHRLPRSTATYTHPQWLSCFSFHNAIFSYFRRIKAQSDIIVDELNLCVASQPMLFWNILRLSDNVAHFILLSSCRTANRKRRFQSHCTDKHSHVRRYFVKVNKWEFFLPLGSSQQAGISVLMNNEKWLDESNLQKRIFFS
jgi:hypothetical protein